MYGLRIFLSALFFSLVFGPHVMLLHAQDLEESTASNRVTEMTSELLHASTEADDTIPAATEETKEVNISFTGTEESTEPTAAATSSTGSSMSTDTAVSQDSESLETEHATTSSQHLPSTTEPLDMKTESSTAMITESSDSWLTTELQHKATVVSNVITTMHPPSSAIKTSAPATVHESTKATEIISTLILSTEKIVETTPSIMAAPRNIITTPHLPPEGFVTSDLVTENCEDSTNTLIDSSTISETTARNIGIIGTENKASVEDSGPNLLIIIIIAVAIFCIATAFCVVIFVRRKKKRRSQHFGHGYMNGRNQRSKKKKGEEDPWAGPVNLEGRDRAECEGPEELGQGDDKNPDGTDMMLSTFAASEGNGGVGRPGSTEVQKWEEQEPLLYIDEEAKTEAKEKQNDGVEKEKVGQKEEEDTSEKTEIKEAEKNGGEAFCLTTAV